MTKMSVPRCVQPPVAAHPRPFAALVQGIRPAVIARQSTLGFQLLLTRSDSFFYVDDTCNGEPMHAKLL